MKKLLSKIIWITLIFMILFSFSISSVLAADTTIDDSTTDESQTTEADDPEFGSFGEAIGGFFDGVTGILLWPLRALVLLVGGIIRAIAGSIAGIGAEGGQNAIFITMEDILFHNVANKVPILNVNFFDTSISSHEVIVGIRTNVAQWYYAIRNLAIILSLFILIYVGIRMAISTVAEDKAKYKGMLTDWVVGFITIFLLHYIIVATVNVNEALIASLYTGGDDGMGSYMTELSNMALNPISGFLRGTAASIVFVGMCGITFSFVWTYVKRMITIAFLIIIAPIITVTYSIDKMGDGKSQALNTWLKEFIYNVLIQPFHCIIYLVFATVLTSILKDSSSLGAGFLAIMIMMFIRQAEDIVRKIFGFDSAKSLGSAVAATALLLSSAKLAASAVGKLNSGKEDSKGDSSSGNSGSSSSSSGKKKKPQVKDTSHKGEEQGNGGGGTNPPAPPDQGGGSDSRDSGSGGGSDSGSGSSNNGGGSNSNQGGNGNNGGNNDSNKNNTASSDRNVDKTKPAVAQKLLSAGKFLAAANIKGFEWAAGAGLGLATGGDISDMIAGKNVMTALSAGGRYVGRGAISKGKNIVNKATANTRTVRDTNAVVQSYNDVKTDTGWSDERMEKESERLLEIEDTSRIKNEKIRTYAENLQTLRKDYEGKYQEPKDKTLDTVNKIGKGTVKYNNRKKYTKKPRTKPTPRT